MTRTQMSTVAYAACVSLTPIGLLVMLLGAPSVGGALIISSIIVLFVWFIVNIVVMEWNS